MTDVINIAKKLIALPTITGTASEDTISELESLLVEEGYELILVNINGIQNYIATIGSGDVHIAFSGHYDVVPPGGGWKTNPFEPEIIENRLYGRGACDMKGAVAAQISAGKKLADAGLRVSLFLAGDEEDLCEGTPALLEEATKQNLPKLQYAIGGEPTSEEESGDVIRVGRRGIVQGNVVIFGVQGHTAYTKESDSVIYTELPEIIDFFKNLNYQFKTKGTYFPKSIIHITSISTGQGKHSIVPGEVTINFDARVSPEDRESIPGLIQDEMKKLNSNFELNLGNLRTPYITQNRFLVDYAHNACLDVNGLNPEKNCGGGYSDAYFFAETNIPIIEIGVPSKGIHGPNEFVTIENLQKLEQIYLNIGRQMLRGR